MVKILPAATLGEERLCLGGLLVLSGESMGMYVLLPIPREEKLTTTYKKIPTLVCDLTF